MAGMLRRNRARVNDNSAAMDAGKWQVQRFAGFPSPWPPMARKVYRQLSRKARVFRAILPYDRKRSTAAARGRGGMTYAAALRKTRVLAGKSETQNWSNSGKPEMAIPSQARRELSREGVET
jgi:hypothetical protein